MAALSAISAAPLELPKPLTEAAQWLVASGAGAARGSALSDDVPSMLLGDEVLSQVRRAASRYVHARYRWWPDGLTDPAPGVWPDAVGGVDPAVDPRAGNALRHDLVAVALARLVVREDTPRVEAFDVRVLSGLTAANDHAYPSLAAFGDAGLLTRAEYFARYGRDPSIGFETANDFAAALAGLRQVLGTEPWRAWHRTWDGRLFLSNDNGAHRLAAVHRYCREQGLALAVRARVGRVFLDAHAAAVLDSFAIWRVAPATYDAFAAALAPAQVTPELDGLYRHERGYATHPAPLADAAAALFALPADHWAVAAVRARLDAAPGAAFDLTSHVQAMLAAQLARQHGR